MATTAPRVDIGALSGELAHDALQRVATTIIRTIDGLAEDDRPLSQLQKIALVHYAHEDMGGFEASAAYTVRDHLGRNGVDSWGLSGDLKLLGGESA